MDHNHHEYDENCRGCQPVIADPNTMIPLPWEHPHNVAVRTALKEKCTYAQRIAWHRVTLLQSTNERDMELYMEASKIMVDAINE